MKINCLILARYGSVRVPKKNLRLYKNKPLIFVFAGDVVDTSFGL